MASQADFDRSLGRLAKLCNFELDPDIVELYDRALAPVGYDAVCRVIDQMALNMSAAKRQWPSVNEIKRACGVDVPVPLPLAERSVEDDARVASALIIRGVGKFGSITATTGSEVIKTEKIKAFVGELGWSIVLALGGWNRLCDQLTVENESIIGAQMRELARAMVDRRLLGLGDKPPSLPPCPTRGGDLEAVSLSAEAKALADGRGAK